MAEKKRDEPLLTRIKGPDLYACGAKYNKIVAISQRNGKVLMTKPGRIV